MANEILGNNQRRRNRRPEEIAAQFSETSSNLLDTALVGSGVTALSKKIAPESVVAPVRSFLQNNPNLQNVAKNLTSIGGKATKIASAPLFGYTVADTAVREATGKGISERVGEKIGGFVGNVLFPGAKEQPAFTTAPTLQALAEQRAGTALTEDDAVDSLQSAIKAAGEQDSNLSPDALRAIQPPVVPEYVTSSDPNAGAPISGERGFTQPMGPMQFIDRETGEPLDPTVVQAAQEAGLTDRLAQGAFPLPEAPETPVSTPPMSVAETNQRLQSRFGAPTLMEIQALPSDDKSARGMQVDAQGRLASKDRGEYDLASAEMQARIADRDRRPGESQTERDTRIAQERTQQSVGAAGRRYTDSQLRRLFPDKDEYQGARVKDMEGIDPLTNQDYRDQDLNRRDTQSQIDAREKRQEDPPNAIDEYRADGEKIAEELYGLEPGTDEYDNYVRDYILDKTGALAYTPPTPTYTDAEADAAYAAGKLKVGDDYLLPDGTPQKYVLPKTKEKEKPRPARERGGRARQEIRNQEDQ